MEQAERRRSRGGSGDYAMQGKNSLRVFLHLCPNPKLHMSELLFPGIFSQPTPSLSFCMFAPSLFCRTSCLLYDYIPTPHAQVNCQPLQKLFAKFPSHVDTVILWEHGGGMKLWQADAPANPPIHMPNNCRPYFTLSPLPFCNLLYFIAMYPIVTYPPVLNTKATA